MVTSATSLGKSGLSDWIIQRVTAVVIAVYVVVVLGWTALVSFVSVFRPDAELHAAAVHEGCAGSAALFIGTVTAICIAMILYTAPRPSRTD